MLMHAVVGAVCINKKNNMELSSRLRIKALHQIFCMRFYFSVLDLHASFPWCADPSRSQVFLPYTARGANLIRESINMFFSTVGLYLKSTIERLVCSRR